MEIFQLELNFNINRVDIKIKIKNIPINLLEMFYNGNAMKLFLFHNTKLK